PRRVGGLLPLSRGAGVVVEVVDGDGGDGDDGEAAGAVETPAEIVIFLAVTDVGLVESVDLAVVRPGRREVRAQKLGLVVLAEPEASEEELAAVAAVALAESGLLIRRNLRQFTASEMLGGERAGLVGREVVAEGDDRAGARGAASKLGMRA